MPSRHIAAEMRCAGDPGTVLLRETPRRLKMESG
jgi:hypothetical protein